MVLRKQKPIQSVVILLDTVLRDHNRLEYLYVWSIQHWLLKVRAHLSLRHTESTNRFLYSLESQRLASDDMLCILYSKEDIQLFEWVSRCLDLPVNDYGRYWENFINVIYF